MKERPEQPDQQKESETITPDEFNTRIDELLDRIFFREVEKKINRSRQAIKTSTGEWIH